MKAIKELISSWNTWYAFLDEKAVRSNDPQYGWEAVSVKKSLDELVEAYNQDSSAMGAPPLSSRIGYYCNECNDMIQYNSITGDKYCSCAHHWEFSARDDADTPDKWIRVIIEARAA